MTRFAFSSNAFKNTDLCDAARQIAAAGYTGMEIMADVPHAYPPAFDAQKRRELKKLMSELGLEAANVNAFTLFAAGDTYHPTWIEQDVTQRQRRIEHTVAAMELAADLGAASVSIQPGGPMIGTGLSRDQAARRFAEGIDAVLPVARKYGISIAIEPEPGLFIQDVGEYAQFKQQFFPDEKLVAMNCDLGHLFCVGDDPQSVIQRYHEQIAHIHLEDIGQNHVHQHLPLGRGAMNIPEILAELERANYRGWVTVELYPYVSTAGEVAVDAMKYLRSISA